MQPIYLIIGIPGSGKTWVCNQLQGKYCHVAHDEYKDGGYVNALFRAAGLERKPILAETPFSISKIREPLEEGGLTVIPIYLLERNSVVTARYKAREGRDIIPGHLTRQVTYNQRAIEEGAFRGTAEEVLAYLKEKAR